MLTGFQHLHSSLRYLVLLFVVITIVNAAVSLGTGKSYAKSSRIFALLGLIFSHVQLLIGLVLYFLGDKGFKVITSVDGFMKMAPARFYAVEHITMMIIAIALITVGYSRAKRQELDRKKYLNVLIYYSIGLIIIFIMIPWPFLRSWGGWM